MKRIDLSGKVFGKWTVVGFKRASKGGSEWLCKCECGTEKNVTSASLRHGLSTSCGCGNSHGVVDETGNRYGRLKVIKRGGTIRSIASWECLCDCGKTTVVTGDALRRGNTRSCGCLHDEARLVAGKANRTHGMFGTRTYKSWSHMIGRCTNKNDARYHDYGGRGISVCERWEMFENFMADMGEAPRCLTLDRINVNGNYEPGNCRWATDKEQARNTRANRIVQAFGKEISLAEWAELTGLNRQTIESRIKRGWTIEDALTTQPGNNAGSKKVSVLLRDVSLM